MAANARPVGPACPRRTCSTVHIGSFFHALPQLADELIAAWFAL